MGQRVSKAEQAATEQMRLERAGLLGLVQCEGCPAGVLVVDNPHDGADRGLCLIHKSSHPDAWMAYEGSPDEGYDVAGNL